MPHRNQYCDEIRRPLGQTKWSMFNQPEHAPGEPNRPTVGPADPRHHHRHDDDEALSVIAHDEGWLVPPAEVVRVALRPWQQAVFWGLRFYIAVMLVVMAIGFARVATGN